MFFQRSKLLGMLLLITVLHGAEAWASADLRTQPLRGLKAGVAHLLFSVEEGGALPLAVLAVPGTAEPGNTTTALVVEIDGQGLLVHHQPPTLPLEIYAYAVTGQGTIAAHLAESLTVDPDVRDEARTTRGEALAAGGLKFRGMLEVPPGDHKLRVLVLHPPSGAFGLRSLPLYIPAPGALDIEPVPLFQEPPDRWTQALASTGVVSFQHSPAARPVLGAGRHMNVFLPVRGVAEQRWRGRLDLNTHDDAVVVAAAESSTDVDVTETTDAGLALRVKVPRVPPGAYRLRLTLTGAGGQKMQSAPLPVLVVKGDTPEQTLLWTDLRWQSPAPAPLLPESVTATAITATAVTATAEAAPSKNTPRRPSRRLEKLAAQYRAGLAPLAHGDVMTARAALREFESAALGRGRDPFAQLRAAEELVHTELAAVEVESLVPVLTLHLELYRDYLRRRLHSLVGHGRATVEHLTALYVDRGGDPRLAADVLAGLAFDLYTRGLLDLGQRRSKDALAHDLEHRAALLGLALGLEKDGDYRGAATVLERLADVHPEFIEGRLRLAINLERTGLAKRAEALLTALVDEQASGWVGALAVEHLARRLLATGRVDETAELLAAATERFPEQAGLRLLRAHLEDRRNAPRQAFEVLADMPPRPGHPAPRWRYDSWPWGLIEDIEATLEAAGRERLEFLAAAIP